MSDEITGLATEQPVPESASQDGTGATPEPQIPAGYVPEDDYKNVQSWATKVAQENKDFMELTAALQDPQHPRFADALERFGLEAPEPEPQLNDFGENDLVQQLATQQQKLEQQFAELTNAQQAQQEQAAIDAAFFQGFSTIQEAIGRELDEDEMDLVANYALGNPTDEGLPNVQFGWEKLQKVLDRQAEQVFKNRKKATKPAAGGVEAGKQPDLSTTQAKTAYAVERLTALNSDD